jgi:general secretion pathway protein C
MLDLFFRKYAWIANLLLLLAAAWLLARTVNTLTGAAIRPRPQADLGALAAPPARTLPPAPLDQDRLYRLIGVEPPAPVAVDAAPPPSTRPQTCEDRSARAVKSDLRLQLVAGVIAEPAAYSLATILDPQTRESKVVGIGEVFGAGRLLSVERLRDERDTVTHNAFKVIAVICNGGTKEYLDGEAGSGSGEAPNLGVAPVPGAPRPAPGAEGIRKVADNRYEIDKQTLDSALSNLNTLATQARMVPSFKNGVANGFKLFAIQPGSLYSSIGIENGDVITRINGYEINSPDKALEIYQKLRDAKNVVLEGERGGQNFKKDYTISGH